MIYSTCANNTKGWLQSHILFQFFTNLKVDWDVQTRLSKREDLKLYLPSSHKHIYMDFQVKEHKYLPITIFIITSRYTDANITVLDLSMIKKHVLGPFSKTISDLTY